MLLLQDGLDDGLQLDEAGLHARLAEADVLAGGAAEGCQQAGSNEEVGVVVIAKMNGCINVCKKM